MSGPHGDADRRDQDAIPGDGSTEDSAVEGTRTEHPGADRVLRDLEGLEQRPVGEHAAAYQQAHERLTRELDSAESRIAGAPGASGPGGAAT
ncbi:hypothetical protein [Kocuria palustris]|uniref:hypothetical protein n=1 Tax=Kocuria palustris TaxID=71999 RepID=UPI0011A2340A|nr:hypothetical protein [Kocuria palustris]